jgi:DNA repair photolyase
MRLLLMVRVGKIECKTLMGRSGIEDVDYAINPYLGCQHACVYCYARFMGRRGHLREPWGSFVDVKTNALKRLAEELPKKKPGVVLLSSVTDPYQPLERSWQLTRGALKQLLDYDFPLNVQTKSTLVLRDLDLLQGFSDCEVGFTVTTLDDKVRRIFEPEASPIAERLEALRTINESGIRTFAFLGPMLPYLSEVNLEELLGELASAGVDRILVDRLNIKAGNWPPIRREVEQNFPDILSFFASALPEGSKYYENLRFKVSDLAKRFNLPTYFCY